MEPDNGSRPLFFTLPQITLRVLLGVGAKGVMAPVLIETIFGKNFMDSSMILDICSVHVGHPSSPFVDIIHG